MEPVFKSAMDLGAGVVEGVTGAMSGGFTSVADDVAVGLFFVPETSAGLDEVGRFRAVSKATTAPATIATRTKMRSSLLRDLGVGEAVGFSKEGRGFFAGGRKEGEVGAGAVGSVARTVDWPQCGQAVVKPSPEAGNSMALQQLWQRHLR